MEGLRARLRNCWALMARTLFLILLLPMGLCWNPARAIGETFTGSGFVVSEYGDLVTNEHVVSGCRTVAVKQGGRSYLATVLASDKNIDLALVRMPSQVKPTEIATVRQSPPLRVGEQAISYGFPLAGALTTEGNLTVGHVSALRGLSDDPNSIQITTPIQLGNSGGPLLDSSGNVIRRRCGQIGRPHCHAYAWRCPPKHQLRH
jgi:S1-C subfamily serine protease